MLFPGTTVHQLARKRVRMSVGILLLGRRSGSIPEMNLFVLLVCVLLSLSTLSPVEAADAGNVIAGLLGALLAIICILALIGWYARNR